MVTGAAISPDRTRVALRTYTAAYEWDVPDGDVVKAITTGTPRLTPLPDEPQGEAIAYTVDGPRFLTLSDEAGPTRCAVRAIDSRSGPAATQLHPDRRAPRPRRRRRPASPDRSVRRLAVASGRRRRSPAWPLVAGRAGSASAEPAAPTRPSQAGTRGLRNPTCRRRRSRRGRPARSRSRVEGHGQPAAGDVDGDGAVGRPRRAAPRRPPRRRRSRRTASRPRRAR